MAKEKKELALKLTGKEALHMAINESIDDFRQLSVADQAMVVAATKKLIDKLKRLDTARRLAIKETLPEDGVVGADFSVTWQNGRGYWSVDQDELAKLYPEKVVKVTHEELDPIFVEDYLAKAKKTKPGQALPPCVTYVCNDEKVLVVRTK